MTDIDLEKEVRSEIEGYMRSGCTEIEVGECVIARVKDEDVEKARRILKPIVIDKRTWEKKHPVMACFGVSVGYRKKVKSALSQAGISSHVWQYEAMY